MRRAALSLLQAAPVRAEPTGGIGAAPDQRGRDLAAPGDARCQGAGRKGWFRNEGGRIGLNGGGSAIRGQAHPRTGLALL